MKKKNNRNRKYNAWQDRTILACIGLGIGWFVLLILGGRPELQPIRDSFGYRLFGKCLISGLIMYFAFLGREKQSGMARILLSGFACTPWQTWLIPSQRMLLLTETVLVYGSIVYLVYQRIKTKKHSQPLFWVVTFFFLMIVSAGKDYTYVTENYSFRHWQPALLAAAMTGGCAYYYVSRGMLHLKDDRLSERISLCLLAFFMGFVLHWSTLNNFNYMLDFSGSKTYSLEIVEKDIDTSSKGNTTYSLIVELDGEQIDLNVSQSKYYQFEVGDRLPVNLYQGLFGDPYYIAE